jgi:probable HAF family extracellular repeat protein
MLDLGSFGGTLGGPSWLNNRSQVVGFSNLPGDATAHPFLWSKAAGLKDLGTLGGTFGSAFWVNESGESVGAATNQNDQAVLAFLWKEGVMTNLGSLAGDPCSSAENINSRGQIVGSSSAQCTFAHTDTRAFLWENGGPMIDLNVFVPPGSGLKLFEAGYVNDRGEILVLGLLPNGDSRTALLVPCEGDDDGCQGESLTVTQNSSGPATQQVRTVTPGSRVTAAILDRLRSRWSWRHSLPDPAVQSAHRLYDR